ncbi:adhesion G protein-coupled receptor A3 isoform X2 [Phymastichus coffea]|uniref:adhesion G protein-coupled receptor A3 isoform X2 n=1 Tax=Phymastichus coffea TaxID=108790 RepID=UPI00273C2309|nr:adhesion G protein-coupled receptor A3 isoform X2 [Phymastichus coffea]
MFKIILILTLVQKIVSSTCPTVNRCNCRHIKPQAEWLRVVCKDIEDITDIDFNPVSVEMIHLDLSKNDISIIKIDTFKYLSNLKRLNLSVNKITLLDEGAFNGLTNLERLDLSKNLISTINSHAFKRLPNLKKLKLNGNRIETLKEGTFHSLQALKQLDVSDNPWNCNCNLFWFSYWIQSNSIKLVPPPECDSPQSLKAKPVKKLRIFKEFECKWSTPSIEIVPDQNQVVFAGDTMTLKCRAPSITSDKSAKLSWLWNSNITSDIIDLGLYNNPQIFSNVKIENRNLDDSGIVASSLSIDPVNEEHSGQWKCFLVSAYGNISQAINVIVISNRTKYCPLAVTRGNKGMYAWPRTVVGWKVELPCEGSSLAAGSVQLISRASYECNSTGKWENLDTEQCPYISATTKILEQFSTVNISLTKLSLPKGSLLETIKKLKNITGEGASLTDPVEVNFVTQILENYASYLVEEAELGTTLIDVVNVLLNLPKSMLKAAEINYKACTRLIKTIELIVEVTPSSQLIQLHKTNMALEEHRVKAESFTGLTCTWYSTTENLYVKLLHCSMSNRTTIINPSNGETMIEASIQLPASLLKNVKDSDISHQLMVSMYADNKLFPKINRLSDEDNTDITTSIAGSKLIGTTLKNLTDPVYVMLKVPLIPFANSKPIPVVWDSSLNNETGGWSNEGCHLSNFINNLIIFHCDRLGYYGLLQDKSFIAEDGKVFAGAKFKYSNPAIYVGSFILLVCLICTAVTYVCCYASIAMPKKAKHCVINTWVAIALLCFLYTSGIQQTENIEICQGVGISLHYLSLCCLFWMTVSANNMYKRLSKSTVDPITDDDELREQPIRKPLLGLYLVGWGIALIICGISGAVNMREYAGYSHCFLTTTGPLAAVFVPAAILLVYLIVLHMLIRCTIRNVDLNGQLSEGTQATENVDLELLEPNPNPGLDRVSLHSSQTVSSEVEDQEHSQMTQLKGLIIVMILYLIAWLCAAMTTANLLNMYIPYKETIFAVLYALSSSSLGMFILLFYGIARSDVRGQWLKMRCWLKQKKNRCCRTRNVSDANPAIPTQPLVPLTTPPISNSQATQIISDTNSLGSSRHTHKSQSSCNTSKLTANDSSRCHVKPNLFVNANLIMLHRQQYRSNNSVTTFNTESAPASVEMFYNPHQSGVARKFFKKQRRNMMKNSNLGPRKHADHGGATSDNGSCVSVPRRAVPKLENDIERNILSTSAKVNNTNIHVEMNPINDAKNVNILSDSGGSVAEDRNIALRYVIGQEHLGKNTRKVNNEPTRPPSAGTNRRKYPPATTNHATCTSPYESDTTESKVEEMKQMRNVSQQCSLECSSGMESMTQIASERSEHNLSDISEVAISIRSTTGALTIRRSSVEETASIDRNQRSYNMCNHHSGSLNSLPMVDRSMISFRNKSSYRNSLNDATSLEFSRAAEDFDKILLDQITDTVNSGTSTSINKRQQELLSFPTAAVAPASSEIKITSEEDEDGEENIVKAVIPLVEQVEVLAGEALPLYDFGQRDERDAHHHHLHHHHHHLYHHKQHYLHGKESSREVRDVDHETDSRSDEEDESMQPEMMNVKKETSV